MAPLGVWYCTGSLATFTVLVLLTTACLSLRHHLPGWPHTLHFRGCLLQDGGDILQCDILQCYIILGDTIVGDIAPGYI